MKYNLSKIKVVHWELDDTINLQNVFIDTEHQPRLELFPNSEERTLFKLVIRWVFRLFTVDAKQVLGYVTEQEFTIQYEKNINNNLEVLRNIFGTSLLNNSLKFDELKANTNVNHVSIPNFTIPTEELEGIISSLQQAADRHE